MSRSDRSTLKLEQETMRPRVSFLEKKRLLISSSLVEIQRKPRLMCGSDRRASGDQDRVWRGREPSALREFRFAAATSAELCYQRRQQLLGRKADVRRSRDNGERRR